MIAEEITNDSEYKGTRILMDARMDNVRLKIQIDFGVGDVIVPGARIIEYPVFLGGETIELLAYPVETAIAEKLQAIVALGERQQSDERLLRRVDLFEPSRLQREARSSRPSTRRSRIDKRPSQPRI